jgi:hypothetical protein
MRARKLIPMELPMDLDDVRLIVKVLDESSGQYKDVVARYVESGAPYLEREYGSSRPEHTRYIAGTDIEIEWPEEEIEDFDRFESDTPRKYVDEVTYVPQIITQPVPASVVGEVQQKYDVLRASHEAKYMAKKVVEDARSVWYESRRLVTPQQQKAQYLIEQQKSQPSAQESKSSTW